MMTAISIILHGLLHVPGKDIPTIHAIVPEITMTILLRKDVTLTILSIIAALHLVKGVACTVPLPLPHLLPSRGKRESYGICVGALYIVHPHLTPAVGLSTATGHPRLPLITPPIVIVIDHIGVPTPLHPPLYIPVMPD
jgi:hypothetical protein